MYEVLSNNRRPSRRANAPGLDDEMWAILEDCWKQDPTKRLHATEVVKSLASHPSQRQYTPAQVWDGSFTSSIRSDLGVYPPFIKEQLIAVAIQGRNRSTAGAQLLT
jgi:hypothetical protein